jgi:hypothetical protein
MLAAVRKAFVLGNITLARRMLERCDASVTSVRSAAPLVREANAHAKDLVILRESDIGSSLDVIHLRFFGLNSNSSRRGRQKSVSPSDERLAIILRLAVTPTTTILV